MRIRKRQVPLPFSSISPVPISSDPNFNRPPAPVVQLPLRQQQSPPPPPCFDPHYLSSESDHPNHPIGQPLPTQARDSSAFHGTSQHMKNKQDYLALNPGEEEEKNNDTRKNSILGAKLGTGSTSSHYQAIERWGEDEKAYPLKKRRGSVETRGDDNDEDDEDHDDTIMVKDTYNKRPMKSNVSKNMKTKLNKKLVICNNEEESKDIACTSVVDNDNANTASNGGAKKRGRGGALMEGSRCSRVNGRGWRCCQQTLVGYSLCEHHLGKGRLRSITSVRNRAKEDRTQANNIGDQDHRGPILSNPSQQLGKQTKGELHHNGESEGEEKKPLMMRKKRVKLGMVKARSMSSLLGQNDGAIGVADDNNN